MAALSHTITSLPSSLQIHLSLPLTHCSVPPSFLPLHLIFLHHSGIRKFSMSDSIFFVVVQTSLYTNIYCKELLVCFKASGFWHAKTISETHLRYPSVAFLWLGTPSWSRFHASSRLPHTSLPSLYFGPSEALQAQPLGLEFTGGTTVSASQQGRQRGQQPQ